MAKKMVVVIVLAAFGAAGAFALPEFKLSGGVGPYITSDFGGGVDATAWVSTSGILWEAKLGHLKTPLYFGQGIGTFFDATYAEFSLGFFLGMGRWEDYLVGEGTSRTVMLDIGMDIGLMLKYPFYVKEHLAIFPLIGINYNLRASTPVDEDSDEIDFEDLSALWFKFGGGLDVYLKERFYLRTEVLYGFRLKNKFEKDAINEMNSLLSGLGGLPAGTGIKADALRGHGLNIKFAVGFRFY
jgi:hypothetical protein